MTQTTDDTLDALGLIREAYRLDAVTVTECRSIFLDWALRLPGDTDTAEAIRQLLARHGDEPHPMTEVLREGLAAPAPARRRGGWRGRREPSDG